MENDTIGIQFEASRDMHAKLKAIAEQERRSMSGQIITILEQAIRDWEERRKTIRSQRSRTVVSA